MSDAIVWLLLAVAVVLWGSMYVPARKYETYDGIIFQWYMCCGILFTALCIHSALGPTLPQGALTYTTRFPIYHEGMVGGAFWAVSNILVVPTVKVLGLAVGFTLYHSINLLMGYLNGKYGLYGLPLETTSIAMDSSMLLFAASFVLVALVEPSVEPPHHVRLHEAENDAKEDTKDDPSAKDSCTIGKEIGDELHLPEAIGKEIGGKEIVEAPKKKGRTFGIACGLIAGYLTSVNMVPFELWATANGGTSHLHFTLSQCVGVFLASTVYLVVASIARLAVYRTWPQQPVLLPAMLCGAFWTCGFVCATVAVAQLGMSVGYVITAVGPVGISALLTQLLFHEVQGAMNQMKLWTAIGLQAVGVILDGCFKPE